MQLHINVSPRHGESLLPTEQRSFGASAVAEVREFMAPLDIAVTPLHDMEALARELGIGALLVKDESARSSLGSFKALGGAYAVIRLVLAAAEKKLLRPVTVGELHTAAVREIARDLTVTCATDGNHGRSVANGARLTGCRAVIWVHCGVSQARVDAIRELGAEIVRVAGSYDDSVGEAARAAQESGWHVISDTSWPGYEELPVTVMQGYLIVADEVVRQCREQGRAPTHVFLQAGVGGFAAAMAAHLSQRLTSATPLFVVVEPTRAACLLRSAIAQKPVRIPPDAPTVMAMLECYEPSLVAWRILERLAYAFIAVDDAAALRAMRRLARPSGTDPFVLSGESGGAGLAGVLEAVRDANVAAALGLDGNSVVLVFNTEGATDTALYRSLLDEPKDA